jgi:hypothetical protein
MNKVVIAREGALSMQVCCDKYATDEEILEVCNRLNPCGTENGWCYVVRQDNEHPYRNPVPCEQHPERLHILVDC